MVTSPSRYSLAGVKDDIKVFFLDNTHWAYVYGSKATSCDKDSVFYKSQIQVIFEDRYPHDVTGKAVNELLVDGFLKEEERSFGSGMRTIFVWRRNLRYVKTIIKSKLNIMERFSNDEVNDGVGKYAEILFSHLFKKNQFIIVDRDSNSFNGIQWPYSERDLDFIIEKDGINYGVEIKNTFKYMPQDEFEEKTEMCRYLGLIPLFPLRCPSPHQYALMQSGNGLALKFKTRIFPPSNQKLVTDIWNNFRLPVFIWEEINPPVERIFLSFHTKNL